MIDAGNQLLEYEFEKFKEYLKYTALMTVGGLATAMATSLGVPGGLFWGRIQAPAAPLAKNRIGASAHSVESLLLYTLILNLNKWMCACHLNFGWAEKNILETQQRHTFDLKQTANYWPQLH